MTKPDVEYTHIHVSGPFPAHLRPSADDFRCTPDRPFDSTEVKKGRWLTVWHDGRFATSGCANCGMRTTVEDTRTILKAAAVRTVTALREAMDRNPAEPQPCAWWDWSEPDLVRCKTGKPAAFEHAKFGRVCEDHRLA